MIHDQDRSGWFGASDTAYIMGKWNTPSFANWWSIKRGIKSNHYASLAMQAGTFYEHRILESIGIQNMDRQVRIRRLRLRVNYDGETSDMIHEVKTHSSNPFKVSKSYWQQCQVEMFASKRLFKRKKCRIVAYQMTDAEYANWFLPVYKERLSFHPIEYDAEWIQSKYLPRLTYLAKCLKTGKWPKEDEHGNPI